MIKSLKRAWKRFVDLGRPTATPRDAHAEFRLLYGPLTVGILSIQEGHWKFRYSDEFRKLDDMRPIVQFPDTDKTYESEELWPFFGMRIPSLKQPSVQAAVKRERIDDKDKVQLLRRFGRRTIANPFELVDG